MSRLSAITNHTLNHISFDCLPVEQVFNIFKDGRVFSHLIESWIADKEWIDHETGDKFKLAHVHGNRDHDFVLHSVNGIEVPETLRQKYDAKTFTSRGCNFMPSSMIGTGRTFNKEAFDAHVGTIIYIIVDNIQFPNIKIRWVKGSDLAVTYPKGKINYNDRNKFFGN